MLDLDFCVQKCQAFESMSFKEKPNFEQQVGCTEGYSYLCINDTLVKQTAMLKKTDTFKKTAISMCAIAMALGLSACSSKGDPMTAYEAAIRTFPEPEPGKAGVYIYRDSNFALLFDKAIFVNGTCIGENSAHSFMYMQLPANRNYVFSADSEFSPNSIKLYLEEGNNYFINHYLKYGLMAPGANLEHIIDVDEGKAGVLNGRLVTTNKCYGTRFNYVAEYPDMHNAAKVNDVLNPVKITVVLPDGTESTPPKFVANWQTATEMEYGQVLELTKAPSTSATAQTQDAQSSQSSESQPGDLNTTTVK